MTEIVKPSLSNSKINTGTGSYAYKASIFDVQLSNNMDYENIDYSGKTELINPELNEGAGANSNIYEYTGATSALDLAGATDASHSLASKSILIPELEPLTHVDPSNTPSSNNPEPEYKYQELGEKINKIYNVTETIKGTIGSAATKIGENLVDMTVMAGATIASKTQRAYGKYLDSLGLHDYAQTYYDAADWVEDKSSSFIGKSYGDDFYEDYVQTHNIDKDIAYSNLHTYGETGATIAGYVAIGVSTGGTGLMPVISAASAGGSAAQKAFQNGATFNEAAINSGVAAAAGYASGYGLDKLGVAARGATSIPQVLGYTGAGALVGASTPAVTSAVEYNTYGNDSYDSYNEYAKATGAYKSMAIGGAVGGTITGVQAAKGYYDFAKEMKEAGVDPRTAHKLMKQSKKDYTTSTEENPLSKEAIKRNKEMAKDPRYRELNKEVAKHNKTMQDYGKVKKNIDSDVLSEAEEYAAKNVAHYKEVEPAMTAEMKTLESESRHLEGMEHVIKGEDSTARKIVDNVEFYGKMKRAANNVNDGVRYTMVCDEATIESDIEQVMTGLKSDGYTIKRFTNTFGETDATYKGINATIKLEDGTQVELQFHTPQSYSVKTDTSHVLYEISRNKGVSTEVEKELATQLCKEATKDIHLEHLAEKYPSGSFVG